MGNCVSNKQTNPGAQTHHVETMNNSNPPAPSPASPPPISLQSQTNVHEQTQDVEKTGNSAAPAPLGTSPSPISPQSPVASSDVPYTVFISHAGEDKATIAIPLRERFQKRGIRAFVDMEDMGVGTEAVSAMVHAMETASVGVFIMSPEFVARKWPMKELICFLRRREECKVARVEGPLIVPFFYRLSISELYDEPRLDRNDKNGKKLYEESRFYDRQQRGEAEANIGGIKRALSSLHGTMGLENVVNANNDSSYNMGVKRAIMLDMLFNKVYDAMPELTVEGVGTEQEEEAKQDTFIAHFDVTDDILDLVFDFEQKDRHGDVFTQEGKILEMVLDESKDRNRAIAVQGIGGVGKTSLLRKMRSLKSICERFENGLYCMELGQDATHETLKEGLVRAVLKSGGKQTAKNMRAMTDMRELMEAFRSWFASKQCLFVVDDVWDTKEVTRSMIRDLWTMHTSGRGSKTLLATRSKEISADGETHFFLEPRKPLEAESRAILYHYAGLKPEERRFEDNRAVEEILKRCAGLPLFLGVAGKAVKTLSFRAGHSGCMAYRFYADQLQTSMSDMINSGVGPHAGLSAGLNISIDLVEERKKRFEFDVAGSMREMHRRLSVMKKQMRVPMMMLQQLWELANESEAARIAKEFEQVGLADVEYEKRECGFVEVLRLHDSVYEFAVYETKRYNEDGIGHKTLLEGYGKGLARSGTQGVLREWWSKELEDDEYLPRNVCRHLMGAKLEEELFGLLLSPEWLERQVEVNGVVFAKDDFSIGIEAMRKRTKKRDNEESNETEEALELIREAITLSSWHITENEKELWFQVHGRLKKSGEYNKMVSKYTRRIEMNARKPRALCRNAILMEAGGPNTGITHVGSGVLCMVLLKDGTSVACGCGNGNIVIVNVRRSEIEKQWRAHDDDVRAINFGEDGTRIVSGSRDKSAKVWDAQSGLCVASFEGQSAEVTCVTMTRDGKRVVCGCEDGSVQVWDIESGLKVSGSIKVDRLKCLTVFKDGEHVVMGGDDGELEIWNMTTNAKAGASFDNGMDRVSCATMTKDESRLVSGSWGGTVRLWDVKTRQPIKNPFDGDTRWIRCVVPSADGRRIVSGSFDGNIRIWDVESGEQIGDPLIRHTSWVTGVSVLGQGDTIVSCSDDMTVRVWNLKRKSSTVNMHRGRVWGVSFCADGTLVVSGSDDGTLQMWNPISGQTVGEPLREKSSEYRVFGAAVSPNGQLALSGSEDGRVRVWDLLTRSLERTLEGHTKAVCCIAVTPDGERAVTGSWDWTVRVWDMRSMDGSHFVLEGHKGRVRSVFLSDDGKRIISVGFPNEIIVWDIEAQMETKTTRTDARLTSRRNVLCAAGESTVHDEAGLSIRRYGTQIIHGEGSEAVVLGTLDSIVNDWAVSPDKGTICVALEDGHVGFLKLEL